MLLSKLFFLLFIFILVAFSGLMLAVFRNLGQWNKTYQKLGARYGGKKKKGGVFYGYMLTNPALAFDYGRTFCRLRNRKTLRFPEGRQTEITMNWPDKRIKLDLSTQTIRSRQWGAGQLVPVELKNANSQFDRAFLIGSNQPRIAAKILSGTVQWQLLQLMRLTPNHSLFVSIHRGTLTISRPGYLKSHQKLDDFIRYSLELFDQMMLYEVQGIEFLNQHEALIVEDAKCPICSEDIGADMVVCRRCKTPHCRDCWEYNGQCATFACCETRFVRIGKAKV